MRIRQFAVILFSCTVAVSALANVKGKRDDRNNAYIWAYKACDRSEKQSSQEVAGNAARANSLDKQWLRLSEAANFLAGADAMSRNKSSWSNALGSGGASVVLEIFTMNAQFQAECVLTYKKP